MVLHHQSYTLDWEMSSPVHTHPDPQKKDLACEKNLPFLNLLNTKTGAFLQVKRARNSKKIQ